jgi:hypothetical protein
MYKEINNKAFLQRYKDKRKAEIDLYNRSLLSTNEGGIRNVSDSRSIKITEKFRSSRMSSLNTITDKEKMLAKLILHSKTEEYIEEVEKNIVRNKDCSFEDYLYMFNEQIIFMFDSDKMSEDQFEKLNKTLNKIKRQFLEFKMKFYEYYVNEDEISFISKHDTFMDWKRKVQVFMKNKDLGSFGKIFNKEDFIIVEKLTGTYQKNSNEVVPIIYNNSEKQFLEMRKKFIELSTQDLNKTEQKTISEKLNALMNEENNNLKNMVLAKKNGDIERYKDFLANYKITKSKRLGCEVEDVHVPSSFTLDKSRYGSSLY